MLAGLAEAAARVITDPDEQTQTLTDLAREAEPNHARSLLARALTVSHWNASLDVLIQIAPAAVTAIADVYLSTMARPKDSPSYGAVQS